MEIREELEKLADSNYQKFQQGLCPGTEKIIGVRIPVLRKLAKQIAKNDFRNYLDTSSTEYYEEKMLQGMIIGIAKMELQERLNHLTNFIPKIDNWAVCDITCSGLKFINENLKAGWQYLHPYLHSNKEFEIRFAVVMLLNYYLTEEYIEAVLQELDQIHHEGYYVKMAVAWTIATAYTKQKEKTAIYLKQNKLDKITYNKAIQKIIESRQIPQNEKNILKQQKR